MNQIIKIGIVGCGNIGLEVAKAIDEGKIPAKLISVCDIRKEKAENLVNVLKSKPQILKLEELISSCNLVFESARFDVVPAVVRNCILKNRNVVIMSVCGLLIDRDILKEVKKSSIKVYIPSGAIGGIDALKSMNFADIEYVKLVTEKPFEAFNNINKKAKGDKLFLFRGNAYEAVKNYPLNVNVAATVSLAGIGPEKTEVEIIANRKLKVNVHTLIVKSKAGFFKVVCKNSACVQHPKTSFIAPLSAIALLKNICENIKIGT